MGNAADGGGRADVGTALRTARPQEAVNAPEIDLVDQRGQRGLAPVDDHEVGPARQRAKQDPVRDHVGCVLLCLLVASCGTYRALEAGF